MDDISREHLKMFTPMKGLSPNFAIFSSSSTEVLFCNAVWK